MKPLVTPCRPAISANVVSSGARGCHFDSGRTLLPVWYTRRQGMVGNEVLVPIHGGLDVRSVDSDQHERIRGLGILDREPDPGEERLGSGFHRAATFQVCEYSLAKNDAVLAPARPEDGCGVVAPALVTYPPVARTELVRWSADAHGRLPVARQ